MNDEQRKADLAKFESEFKAYTAKLPNHKFKEFTFSALEQQMLAEQETIVSLAERTKNKIINELCMKRIGIQSSPAIHILYSIGLGRFVCFIPKLPKAHKE